MAAPVVEQPTDWTEPGAHPVAPGVHRIPLALPIPSLHAVNVYVIEDAEGLVVVDSGWAMPDTKASLEAALSVLGHRLDDVAQFLVTHAHWDHYSQALALRESFGTRVRIGRGERPSIEAFDTRRGLHPRQVELLRRCGADEVADEIAGRPVERSEQDVPHTMPDAWLDDGERVALTERGLDVFATPGHTRGHIVLRDAAAGLLFAGDHILPHITPSIGLETEPEPKPLRSYLESLRLVRDMPDTVLLPAHGPVRPSVHTRIDELLEHHAERLDAAAAQVRAGRATAFEVAAAMPWTRRRRSLGDLDAFSRMLAVLEIEAHLDVLADRGVLDAHEEGGVRRYAAGR
ncbi:MBL fold metallo-hydrolase [Actinomadura sp. NPDC048955]|uniref:Glyoxylase-like metal-dependent hydrolase (Beta-lactamase superfamily II) n=2 Tax=Actinomadura luteofluorescens TaxID=46163 RepID=A0A7Y9JM27_9ACTN|nr:MULTISPECIES: MBL fold metallo-hydrolase [Actinomadura]MCR3743130.1 Glyoxylase, beta-lactamase superfamily II [Actinomadura glauciflava]NYD52179.1 glyoxylase-like metal-dependent hydrolase (beta-lactamase superfamily II) [Actinomadura luteofluorescens]